MHQHSQVLKELITAKAIQVHKKYMNPYMTEDYSRHVFLSNSRVPVTIEPGDRRYVFIEPSDEKIGNLDYFSKLVQDFKDQAGEIFNYLANYKIDYDIRDPKNIPITKMKQDLLRSSLNLPHQFLLDLYDTCEEKSDVYNLLMSDDVRMPTQAYYDRYRSWLITSGIERKGCTSINYFMDGLKEWNVIKSERRNEKSFMVYNKNQLQTKLRQLLRSPDFTLGMRSDVSESPVKEETEESIMREIARLQALLEKTKKISSA